MKRVYSVFNEKLPNSIQKLLPGKDKLITFWNPYSMYQSAKYLSEFSNFSYIGSDGILPIIVQRMFGFKITERFSFDMSSVAKEVFDYSVIMNLRIYFIGSKKNQIEKFILNLKERYPKLNIAGWRDGYFSEEDENQIISDIILLNPDVIVVGLGTPKQEKYAIKLKEAGFSGTIYTCGGFIHQASEKFEYFNGIINRLHLRGFYRIFKERYVLKRVILFYPRFLISYSYYMLQYKLYGNRS